MSKEHAKREIVTSDKAEGSGRKNNEQIPSRESGEKYNEESASSIKSHRKGDKKKKKKMKKVVYYENDSSSPFTSGVRSIVRCLFAILAFLNMLLYFQYP
jgi:hypothetical protein